MSACVAFELCHPLLLCGNELREYTTQSGVRATARGLLCLSNNTNHLVAIWRPSAAEGRGEEPSLANSARPGVTKKEALELSA